MIAYAAIPTANQPAAGRNVTLVSDTQFRSGDDAFYVLLRYVVPIGIATASVAVFL